MATKNYKRIILFATTMGAFIVPFMISSVNIALPYIAKEFEMNTVTLNWVVLTFILSMAVFIAPFGRLADIYGRKTLLIFGMTFCIIVSILCGISFNSHMLIIFRILQGISSAPISVTVISILTSVYPPGKRGKILGLNIAATYTGLSSGPFLGGILTKYLGWRSVFFFIVPIGIIVIILLLKIKQEWIGTKNEKFDYKGSIIYGVGLFGIIYGLSVIRSYSGVMLIIAGIIFISIFGYYENKIKNPILNITLLRNNRILIFSSLAALINYSATFAISYLLSLYLQYIKYLEPQQAGLVLVTQPVIQALFSPLAGRLSDKIEPRIIASLGMTLTTMGLAFFIFLTENTHIIFIISALMIIGMGFAFFASPNTNAVMSSVEKRYYGVASGIIGTARYVGQAFSMGITSLIMLVYIGANIQISKGYYTVFLSSVKVTFFVFAVLCVIGIFISIARGKIKLENEIKET